MITTAEELIGLLRTRGLLDESAAKPDRNAGNSDSANDRPWYITVLLGASGWLAGFFLLVFVFILFKLDSAGAAFVTGVVLLIAAWGLFMVDRDGAFVSQLALALSVAGQIAVLFGASESLFKQSHSIAGLATFALILQSVLIVAMPNRLHRMLSALFACAAWALAVRYGLWDRQPEPMAQATPSLPLAIAGWVLVWLPVGALLVALIRKEATWMARGWQALLRPLSIGLIAGLAAATLLSQPWESFTWWAGSTPVRQNWLALWPLLSALAALGALAAAFALGSRGLIGGCVIAALLHISHFYYAMGASLLLKSITLLVLGALLLCGARLLNRRSART
jgi:hypothetical protein